MTNTHQTNTLAPNAVAIGTGEPIPYALASAGETIAQRIIDELPAVTTLWYVDYRDELTPAQVSSFFHGDVVEAECALWETVTEHWADDRYRAEMEYVRDAARDAYGDDWEDALDIIAQTDDIEDVRCAVSDRDDSNIVRDLVRGTADPTVRIRLDMLDDMPDMTDELDDVDEWLDETAAALVSMMGEGVTSAETDAVRRSLVTILANHTYGGSLYLLATVDLWTWIDEHGRHGSTPDAYVVDGGTLLGYCAMNGAGMDAERLPHPVRLPADDVDVILDAGSYSWTEDVAGTVPGAYAADVTLIFADDENEEVRSDV